MLSKFKIRAGILSGLLLIAAASPAWACGGLIGPRGAVNLGRTTTLAAYHAGVEHYITAFEFAGSGGEFGSLVPLPGIPTNIERGGDWTLQRLKREVTPVAAFAAASEARSSGGDAQVIFETRIDALDLTVLKGGGDAVGKWAKEHGFVLPPDAPEVLDFYAKRSPIFMAAVFDGDAAAERGQQTGDGTPIHVTIPTANPWVPLRILSLGKQAQETVEADVFLLTDKRPALLPIRNEGLSLQRREPASDALLADLRSDKGMEWLPASGMWLTYLTVNASASDLGYDLAVDASGRGRPSYRAAGLAAPARPQPSPSPTIEPDPSPSPVAQPEPTIVPEQRVLAARQDRRLNAPATAALVLLILCGAGLMISRVHRRPR